GERRVRELGRNIGRDGPCRIERRSEERGARAVAAEGEGNFDALVTTGRGQRDDIAIVNRRGAHGEGRQNRRSWCHHLDGHTVRDREGPICLDIELVADNLTGRTSSWIGPNAATRTERATTINIGSANERIAARAHVHEEPV